MTRSNPYFLGLDEHQERLVKSSGFPTVDEFFKNPDKYRRTNDEILELIERGPDTLRNATAGRHILSVVGNKVESLGQMARVAKDMGFDLKKMKFTVNLENVGGGKFIHHVNLVPEKDFQSDETG